jgi:hypothetical protein
MQNTVTRKISPESPIYGPFAFNSAVLIVAGLVYLFNATNLPSIKVLSSPTKQH